MTQERRSAEDPGDGELPFIAVVVPCFREKKHILGVLGTIGPEVRRIFVVDDSCPEDTGAFVRESCDDPRVEVIVLESNQGVGGATIRGYRAAIDAGAEVIVKLDGDGQMDPALIPSLVAPILRGEADYSKGNRFSGLGGLEEMPKLRIFGNLGLSFMSKMSSGYWDVFDPTNGFTAIHAKVAAALPLDRIARTFFFESDMLFRLYMLGAVVADVPMRARYGDETSSLSVRQVLFEFSRRHFVNANRRIAFTYFVRDFGVASVELVLGKILFLFGLIFGLLKWHESIETGIPATAGTVILAALPIIIGTQMLLGFLNQDTRNVPRKPLHPRL